VTQFNFNGWGNKQVHGNDGKIAARVAERMGLQVFDAGLVGEAGGVETDGHGTLIAHESTFINPNRNKGSRPRSRRCCWTRWAPKDDLGARHQGRRHHRLPHRRAGPFREAGPGADPDGRDEVDPDDPWSVAAAETHDILAAATDAEGAQAGTGRAARAL
jgi:agmatine deiminase